MESEGKEVVAESENFQQSPEEVPLTNQNGDEENKKMENEDCPYTSRSPNITEEMDKSGTPNLVEAPLPSQSNNPTSRSNKPGMESKSSTTPPSPEEMDQNSTPNLSEAPLRNQCASPTSRSNIPAMESKDPTAPQSPEEMDESTASTPTETPILSKCDECTSHNESRDAESKNCTIAASTEDTTCSVEVPVSSEFSDDSKDKESETHIVVSQDTTSCLPVEASTSLPQLNDNDRVTMESEVCAVTLSNVDVTLSPVELSKPNQEGVTTSPSILETTDDPSNTHNTSSQGSSSNPSKSGQKVKKGLKRKTPSTNKGIQTSIHLLDTNSTFRDRIVDLDTLRRETGVVSVEDLQDLDVSLVEWPMLLVNQLQLRDTIINNLNGVIRELVECGQVLEQDLDYLKLKILELQQETKRKAKEDQQSHKNQGKETESQTTEEDFTEAWSRWYYGRWGDYYSESDPTSSMYWPGHYMQQTTVASKDSRDEETQQEVLMNKEQSGDTSEPHEGVNSEKDSAKKKKRRKERSKEKESPHEKSEARSSDKRKKLKGKRKKRQKSEKSSKEQMSEEEESKKTKDADKEIKKEKKEEEKIRIKEENNDESQITDSPVETQPSQVEITVPTSTTELNGTEEKEDRPNGWDTTQSITQQVATVAAQAVVESGYVFQEELGLYYDYNTGYYYNAENGLYYDTKSGTYFYYDHTTQSYQFHSQVSPTTTTTKNKKRSRKKASEKKTAKSTNKNEDTDEKEEGECTESDEGDDDDSKEESEEVNEEEDIASNQHEEEGPEGGDIPPSLRLMVLEGGERVRVGELHVVTLNGGTVGREATNDVHLPDLNVSKMHADIEYQSTGVSDHHYFLRDLGSNNGTFVNSVRLSEARQTSKQVEVGHGWEVQFGPIKVKCHLHPGNLTCNECEPGLVMQTLPVGTLKPGETVTSFKNAKSKEKARRKELKAMQKKYKLTHRDPQSSSTLAAGYKDRTLIRQAEKGSDNPYEKTEVASSELPLRETNRGFALLQKMGWSQGQGLGKANSGRTEPVQPVSVVGQGGLGSSQSSALPTTDPWTHRRRKQLQITQERYKHSTLGN